MFGIIGWILFGLVVGAIAKLIMPGRDPGGIIVTMLLGMVGAVLALRTTYFEPLQAFAPAVSFTTVTMAIIGGMRNSLLQAGTIEEVRAETIVVGNRGTHGSWWRVRDSVPNLVLRHSPCSVLIVDTRRAQ